MARHPKIPEPVERALYAITDGLAGDRSYGLGGYTGAEHDEWLRVTVIDGKPTTMLYHWPDNPEGTRTQHDSWDAVLVWLDRFIEETA